MNKDATIYVAGHTGLVGSAIMRKLKAEGYTKVITQNVDELDLTRQKETEAFFKKEKPEYVILAAAKVGGIQANNTLRGEFIYENLMIAANVINASYQVGVKKLLNLGSSCVYPRLADQPLKEDYLLNGPLEETNEPYAVAKIAAIKLCGAYNTQYGTNFLSLMPTNLYGPGDNYDLTTSHVIPALIRKYHLAKLLLEERYDEIIDDLKCYGNMRQALSAKRLAKEKKASRSAPCAMRPQDIPAHLARFGIVHNIAALSDRRPALVTVEVWGSGTPYREFMYVDDMANAALFIMQKYNAKDIGEIINVGTGEDIQVRDLAALVREIVGFTGDISWDTSKPDGMPKRQLDVTRIKALGWEAKTNLEEGIRRTYQHYLSKSAICEK